VHISHSLPATSQLPHCPPLHKHTPALSQLKHKQHLQQLQQQQQILLSNPNRNARASHEESLKCTVSAAAAKLQCHLARHDVLLAKTPNHTPSSSLDGAFSAAPLLVKSGASWTAGSSAAAAAVTAGAVAGAVPCSQMPADVMQQQIRLEQQQEAVAAAQQQLQEQRTELDSARQQVEAERQHQMMQQQQIEAQRAALTKQADELWEWGQVLRSTQVALKQREQQLRVHEQAAAPSAPAAAAATATAAVGDKEA
jgi:hypothetical protein